jgi:YVTN family beta-propeller protein
MLRHLVFAWLSLCAVTRAQFEARHVHPVALTPDGAHLLAVNSPDASLSVFDVTNPARPAPMLVAEIAVGLEPVSVKARTPDEFWVVNELSDSVSIVSLSGRRVIDTLSVPDEPADVTFAAGKAFVTCARYNLIRVFDATTRLPLGSIPLTGLYPRALAASADGSRLYAAFLFSGNGTTILPRNVAPAQPAPSNNSLPNPPRTALIVPATDPRIGFTVLDHDIVEIDTSSLTILRYLGGTGTHPFDLAIHPQSGELWIANSQSLNLTRFEPELRGDFARHRLTRVPLSGTPAPQIHDLNPGINHAILPNEPAKAIALAQPTALALTPDGSRAWVAAFNSDRIAEVDTATGAVLHRTDVRMNGGNSTAMRGPRGLALSPDGSRLHVLNKLSNSITTIDTASRSILSEIPTGSLDPTPPVVRSGRGFLFDARLSGNGTVSCATCHLDADRDGLAWDLGDPAGSMVTVQGANLSAHNLTLRNRQLHPMKGPMTTQTLRGMASNIAGVTQPPAAVTPKFHWRGDKPSIQSFNSTFPNLMGGSPLPAADMDALAAYLTTIPHHPNPNRNPDRSLPVSFNGGNASAGRDLFNNHLESHCVVCHPLPAGTDHNLDLRREVDGTQDMKTPPLRLVYQRAGIYHPTPGGVSLSGFGLGSDGTGHEMPRVHFYQLDALEDGPQLDNLTAFLLCFDTGTAPAVGRSVTVDNLSRNSALAFAEITLLEGQVAANNCDLVVRGQLAGTGRRFHYVGPNYQSDRSSEAPLSRTALLDLLAAGDSLTFLGVPPGSGTRLGGDRDGDGIRDGDEAQPWALLEQTPGQFSFEWSAGRDDWFPQSSPSPSAGWTPWTAPPRTNGGSLQLDWPTGTAGRRFFRLQRTW